MQCPKDSQIAFVVKDKFTKVIWRSSFVQFYYFVENITKVKVQTLRFPELTLASNFFRVLSISWSYRCKKHTTSTFAPLAKIFVRLMMVSIILPSKQRDIPVFKDKLRIAPMRVIYNSNTLEQLKTKIKNPYIDWTVTL